MIVKLRRAVLVAALCLPAVAIAGPSGPAAAAPTFKVSTNHGPAGTEITVTAEGCLEGGDSFNNLQALLISGTAPNERLAASGGQFQPGMALKLVVPDWIDPSDPAVIEVRCLTYPDPEAPKDGSGPGITTFYPEIGTTYEPVAFDVEPGTGPSRQTRTFSRTSLKTGQAFRVSSSGCTLPGAKFAGVIVSQGSDLSGRTLSRDGAFGQGEVDGSSFDVDTVMSGGSGIGYGVSKTNDEPPVVTDVAEYPMDLAPGTYVATPVCAGGKDDRNPTVLSFEPQLIQVTGTSPVGALDLTVAPDTDKVTFAGSGCTAGSVDIVLKARSAEELSSDFGDPFPDGSGGSSTDASAQRASMAAAGLSRPSTRVTRSHGTTTVRRVRRSLPVRRAGHADRALADDGTVETSVSPDVNGDWSFTDVAGFDNGIVQADAICGDPSGDGFVYNSQIAKVAVPAPPTPEPPAPAPAPILPPPPAPLPANAIAGNPNFTG